MYIYTYIYMYIYTYINTYIYIYIYLYTLNMMHSQQTFNSTLRVGVWVAVIKHIPRRSDVNHVDTGVVDA